MIIHLLNRDENLSFVLDDNLYYIFRIIFENLNKIWKLVGWVLPIDSSNIIENTPRRKIHPIKTIKHI